MNARLFFLLITVSFFLANPVTATNTDDSRSIYFILDASGSMWGRINGELKIEAARKVLRRVITELPTGVLAGLMAYGHRREGDCNDIEEIFPIGTTNREIILKRIDLIKPRGKTPLYRSVEEALKLTPKGSAVHTILLISDGIETCSSDPCALLTELKKNSTTQFILHVVGFGVNDQATRELSCLANAGGGRYFAAANSVELLDALSEVKESVTKNEPLPLKKMEMPAQVPSPLEKPLSSGSSSIRVKAKGPGRISFKHEAWLKTPYRWRLVDPETSEERGRFSTLETVAVPPGEYRICWDQYEHASSEVMLGEVVSVVSGETVEVPLLTAVELELPHWAKSPYYWGLREPGADKLSCSFSALEPFLVLPGVFELVFRQSEHGAKEAVLKTVTISPDSLNIVPLKTSLNPCPAEWVGNEIRYWGLKPQDNENLTVWFDSLEPQLVPPGDYHFIFRQSEHGSTDSDLGEVKVVEGETTDFLINTGIKFIPADQEQDPPYFIKFIELDLNGKELNTIRLSNSFGPFPLKASNYRIDYRQSEHGSSTMTIVDALEVPSGVLVEVEL